VIVVEARPSAGARTSSALRRTIALAFDRPRAALWTTLALVCALVAVAVAGLAATTVDRWTAERPGASAGMVVYLGAGVTDARANELAIQLRALRGVDRVEVVSADDSARRLVATLGADAALLDGVDVHALPASLEITLAPGVRDIVAMSPTVHALRGAPGVAEVVIASPAIEEPTDDRASGALGAVRAVAWSGAALFGGLALLVVLAAVRVRLDRRAHEARVIALLGGAPSFTIVPTALAGALHTTVAALIALAVVALGVQLWGDGITDALARTLGRVEVAAPSLQLVLGFVAASGLLGLVAGALAGAARIAAADRRLACGALA
jgi:cell division protein FtsX